MNFAYKRFRKVFTIHNRIATELIGFDIMLTLTEWVSTQWSLCLLDNNLWVKLFTKSAHHSFLCLRAELMHRYQFFECNNFRFQFKTILSYFWDWLNLRNSATIGIFSFQEVFLLDFMYLFYICLIQISR